MCNLFSHRIPPSFSALPLSPFLYVATPASSYAAGSFLFPLISSSLALSLCLFLVVRSSGSSGQTKPSPDVITASHTEGEETGGRNVGAKRLATLKTCQSHRETQEKAQTRERGRQEREREWCCKLALDPCKLTIN